MFKKILKSFDYSIIAVYVLLCLFGLVMIYSASMVVAVQRYGVDSAFFYDRQKLNLCLAFLLFLVTAFLPYKIYQTNKFLISIMGIIVVGLLSIFVFGHVSNNAQSWLEIGTASLQPSEFAKLVVIIYLSAVYAKKQAYIDSFNRGVAPPLIFLIVVCLMVGIQPDIGTASIIFLIGCTIIVSSGMKFKTIMRLFSIGLGVLVVFSPFIFLARHKIFTPERLSRFTGFLHPFKTEGSDGLQLVNSYLAIGSGGIKGQGLGQSIQKLGYLPEPHTDFIMAIIAEELGVAGVLFVILGLAYLVLRGIYIGVKIKDPFGSLLAIGISSMLAIQSFINLGGVCGLIPITGVPLPFISYGGSSLVLLSLSMGILVNVSMFKNYEENFKKKQEKHKETDYHSKRPFKIYSR
ncbi:FtsW/RodA/SpoVE family cell cycle protein [Heyndrickxia ginsengihumi]|uniref:Probable peptidoglycan glycosyltransferase FtsW n=1 Tax=Heyndrickxia ginsengihumi TaxID=363870 RepID=A0A0A6XW02_9BACI|nr:FtsW/RodA/SpoVE family cell cycle protein [Heyndrickxia ginsengihumi]KHD84302.1 cell division protein FtsW [Heyndrickxia ginsengihumi]MBE6183665.1 FtsW/RodA/SpoVE family cell cycle protein [Bacillus sp. (in: firmicutes)]MCM3022375.1 FtsW/RodA/SpoVE family cell cycle protein [Heyndrickxia ginsengihumi]NEY18683.1 FtsW/RodA/SpoVE family cell cycle protein [Heyndrickxia ginsengihumi]